MEQLSLNINEETRSKIIASSPLGFQIELIERVEAEDLPALIDVPAKLRVDATSIGEQIDLDWTVTLQDFVGASGTTSIDLSDGGPYFSAQMQTQSMPTSVFHPDLYPVQFLQWP